jgi:hypothetical protein
MRLSSQITSAAAYEIPVYSTQSYKLAAVLRKQSSSNAFIHGGINASLKQVLINRSNLTVDCSSNVPVVFHYQIRMEAESIDWFWTTEHFHALGRQERTLRNMRLDDQRLDRGNAI